MKLYVIRHGITAGNKEKRYIGKRTDEPLCPEGIIELKDRKYPCFDKALLSPMIRCIQTADVICPAADRLVLDGLEEMDFGDFEGKNYRELSQNKEYQRWVDSGCESAVPNGESRGQFCQRTVKAFMEGKSFLEDAKCPAVIAHGGTVMALCEFFLGGNYFDYAVENGGFTELEI